MPIKRLSQSSFLTFEKYSSMLAGNTAFLPAYELLETTVLTGNATEVNFSNLNTTYGSTYQHLQIRAVYSGGATVCSLRLVLNSDSATNYSLHNINGNGSTVASVGFANTDIIPLGNSVTTTSAFSVAIADILDPFETTKYKTVRILHGRTGSSNSIELLSGAWRNTAAITAIKLRVDGGQNLIAGTRLSLYGLRSS